MGQNRRKFLRSVALGSGIVADFSARSAPGRAYANGPKTASGQNGNSSPSPPRFANAMGFEEAVIFRPAKRPGYSAWVAPWRGTDGSLFLSFIEKRRLPNPTHRPIPMDFWESMGLPTKYQASFLTVKDVLTESVVLQSMDEGSTWKEVGRSITNCLHHFAYLSLPDGSFIRGSHNAYLAYYANERVICSIQRSTDMGNTWSDLAIVCEDLFFYPYRLLTLQDGALVFLGSYENAFGPGRATHRRGDAPGNVRQNVQAALYFSYDQGRNWEGPVPVLSGVVADEPDWAELSSGDLLIVNSSVQAGPNARQIIRRQGKRFVPKPVFNIVSGSVPETFLVTKDGLLVGTRRGGVYSCSKDLGNTWYEIGGLPKSLYQPRIVELNDGRLCNLFHLGGDNIVGEIDQYVGKHVFRLDEHLPAPTTLLLTRDKNAASTQCINAFTGTLTAEGKPLAGKSLKFTVRASSRHRKSYQTDEYVRQTDSDGRAHVALPAFDTCLDIHRDYTVLADFTPAVDDVMTPPATSTKYACYRMTATAGKKNTYNFYVAGQTLFVVPNVLQDLPELNGFVQAFGREPTFRGADVQTQLNLTPERAGRFFDILVRNNVLRRGGGDALSWNEVEVKEVHPILVEDDFLA